MMTRKDEKPKDNREVLALRLDPDKPEGEFKSLGGSKADEWNKISDAVVRLRFAAVVSVGCTGLAAARRPVSRMATIGTARAQKRRFKRPGT
jgi:hypothetical protein